ncbi:VCBS repeat protein [Actinoplanes xinjiangensis]|uniref:VCBS repeat protein n=2 Tax=Actinoplanes xinjiangensis TaxID=512350 RepID=A0A316FIT9_9ACTN|nr:VCBS repeat protein [Actinoplanes xinjiangensis]
MYISTRGRVSAWLGRLTAIAASTTVLVGIAVTQPTAAAAAANPNPSRQTEASWWLMEQLLDLEPGTRNGGIYANKPGYHNSRAGNDPGNYSVRDTEDKGGPSDKAAAYDWTFPDAQSASVNIAGLAASDYAGPVNAADFQAASADYSTIAKYSKRLLASGQDSADDRLDGWKEFFGQADNDNNVEGYDFRDDRTSTSDDSHLWHIHLSEDRNKVESYENKQALLSVLRGETLAQWRGRKTFDSFNGDARADMIVHAGTEVSVRKGAGGGGFDGGAVVTSGWGRYHGMQVTDGLGRLHFADFNNDHYTDMIVHHGSDVSVRYNNGNGAFDGGRTVTSGWGRYHGLDVPNGLGRLYFTDFNADGRADMIVHHGSDVSVRYNNGDGAFDDGRTVTSGWGRYHGLQVPDGLGRLFFADADSDGRADMIVHHGSDISVRYNVGEGFDGGRTVTSGWGRYHGLDAPNGLGRLHFADYDGDQLDDMIVHDGSAVSVRLNVGGGFDGGRTVTSGWGRFHGMQIADGLGRLYFA